MLETRALSGTSILPGFCTMRLTTTLKATFLREIRLLAFLCRGSVSTPNGRSALVALDFFVDQVLADQRVRILVSAVLVLARVLQR